METIDNSSRNKKGLRSFAKKLLFALALFVGSLAIDKHLTQIALSNDKHDIRRSISALNDGDNFSTPKVLNSDRIMMYYSGLIVIEEYKLIFQLVPKVASSEWRKMFIRMMHNPKWCLRDLKSHDPSVNKFRYLSSYSLEEATRMMTSPEWTRAIFVREPKKRILSAFLDKAVNTNHHMFCCYKISDKNAAARCKNCKALSGEAYDTCARTPENFKIFLDTVIKHKEACWDPHWEPQAFKIDEKWWPYFNFVGHQENLYEDAKRLLQGLYSTKDPSGPSAWERFGTSGWGLKQEGCHDKPSLFLQKNLSTHKTKTDTRMTFYYTPETEKMLEEHWQSEWNIEGVDFPEIKLFED